MPAILKVERPVAGEFAPYYGRYIERITTDDALPVLESQIEETHRALRALTDKRALHRYATGKWSVKEVVQHLTDAERVFTYRALRFARNDSAELPGFDENLWAPASFADRRPIEELADEYRAVRAATVALYRSFEPDWLVRRGVASGHVMSVRALAWVCAGHENHHREILRERYDLA
ncbi:MAG TPA: DinB family protein [Candidatus Sulfotelmatobacter sp.]|nr:DinB family protein [Candidatus Sulfotelmatobacter sp.]